MYIGKKKVAFLYKLSCISPTTDMVLSIFTIRAKKAINGSNIKLYTTKPYIALLAFALNILKNHIHLH